MRNLQAFLIRQGAVVSQWHSTSISVLTEPRTILSANENKEFVNKIIDDLQAITAGSFGTKLEEQSSDGVRDHVINVDGLSFLHDGDELLGFASSKLFPEQGIFYLHGIAIARHFKGKGSGVALTKSLMDVVRLPLIAFTTQNPIMFRLLRSLSVATFPSPALKEIPEHLQSVGKGLVNGRSGHFDPTTFVVRELYGRCLYGTIPNCGDPLVDHWFAETLAIKNGLTRNAFLFIGDGKR